MNFSWLCYYFLPHFWGLLLLFCPFVLFLGLSLAFLRVVMLMVIYKLGWEGGRAGLEETDISSGGKVC